MFDSVYKTDRKAMLKSIHKLMDEADADNYKKTKKPQTQANHE